MQTTGRPVRRSISLLLSLLMVLTALPLTSVTAEAAASMDEKLELYLNTIPDDFASTITRSGQATTIVGQAGWNASGSGGAGNSNASLSDFGNLTSHQTAGAYVGSKGGGQVVWNALNTYHQKVLAIYNDGNLRKNPVITGSGDAGRRQRPDQVPGANWSVKGSNYTAEMIRATIAAQVSDPVGALKYFSGNFKVNIDDSLDTASYDLLDLPRITWSEHHRTIVIGIPGSWSGWGNWINAWRRSPGGFAVSRSPIEAVQNGTNLDGVTKTSRNLNDYGSSQAYETAMEISYTHRASYGTKWTWNDGTIVGTQYEYDFGFIFHHLDAAPVVRYGSNGSWANTQITGGARNAITLNTQVLKQWRDATTYGGLAPYDFVGDPTNPNALAWSRLSITQLQQMAADYQNAYNAMIANTFPTTVGNGGVVNLLASGNKPVLEWFHLPDAAWGNDFYNTIMYWQGVRGLDVHFFYGEGPTPLDQPWGVLRSQNAWNYFQTNTFTGYDDPRHAPSLSFINGVDDLFEMYGRGKSAYDHLKWAYDNQVGYPTIWPSYVSAHFEHDSETPKLDTPLQWVNNVGRLIYLWMAWDIYDFIQATAGFHDGANDNMNPDDPNKPFDDSNYKHPTPEVRAWYDQAKGYLAVLNGLPSQYNDIAPNFPIGGNLITQLTSRIATLEGELRYRVDLGVSEDTWYSYRDYFEPMKWSTAYNSMTNQQVFALFHTTAAAAVPPPYFMGAHENQINYKVLEEAARNAVSAGKLTQTQWNEIYGRYEDEGVRAALLHLLSTPAQRLTEQVDKAMNIVRHADANNLITFTAASGYSDITFLSWGTFAALKTAINEMTANDEYLYKELIRANWTEYNNDYWDGRRAMGKDGRPSFRNLPNQLNAVVAGSPVPAGQIGDYTGIDRWKSTEADYLWLKSRVLAAINYFSVHAHEYYKSSNLIPPYRGVNPNGLLDILPGHEYADVGFTTPYTAMRAFPFSTPASYDTVHDPVRQTPNFPAPPISWPRYNNKDDAALNTLIDKLDYVLGSGGNFKPLLEMLGADKMLGGLGITLDETTNLDSLLQSVLSNLVYTDETANMLMGMLYPMILNLLETMLRDQVLGMLDDVNIGGVDLTVKHLHWAVNTTGDSSDKTFGAVDIYPHLFGQAMQSTYFSNVKTLLTASNHGNQWEGVTSKTGSGSLPVNNTIREERLVAGATTPQAQTAARVQYPTGSWEVANAPTLYRLKEGEDGLRENASGVPIVGTHDPGEYEFWLPWYIDTYPPDHSVVALRNQPRPAAERKERFESALAEMLRGIFPIVNAMFLGNSITLTKDAMGTATVISIIPINAAIILKIDGIQGLAQLLTPIYECLLGEDTSVILSANQWKNPKGITGNTGSGSSSDNATTLATQGNGSPGSTNAAYRAALAVTQNLLAPIYTFFNRLSTRPVTEIINLLPNVCYALSLDRILELLKSLFIKLHYKIDAGAVLGWIVGLFTDYLEGDLDPIDLSDMLGDLHLDEVLEANNLVNMIVGPDGLLGDLLGGASLPSFNLPRIASYGQFRSTTLTGTYPDGTSKNITTKRVAPGGGTPMRHYVQTDKPDVMQRLLMWILQAADKLLPALGLDLSTLPLTLFGGQPIEQVAALAELVLPREYPADVVTYGEPDQPEPPYPAWWDGAHPNGADKARLDGEYLVSNADVLLDLLWGTLHPSESLGDGIRRALIAPMFDGSMMVDLVEMIQGMIVGLLESPALGDFDLLNMVEMLVRIDGKKLNLQKFFDYPLGTKFGDPARPQRESFAVGAAGDAAYRTALINWLTNGNPISGALRSRPLKAYYEAAVWSTDTIPVLLKPAGLLYGRDYDDDLEKYQADVAAHFAAGGAGEISSVADFFDATIQLLEPLNQVLDFLLDKKALELVNIGDNTGLLKILGGSGFADGLTHIVGMITRPLGIDTSVGAWDPPPAVGTADYAKWQRKYSMLGQILFPLTVALDKLIDKPISTLLSVLPNIAYFLTNPKPGDPTSPGSPLEQSLNNLLRPLYVLLDTLRPIADVDVLLKDMLGGPDLPSGLDLYPLPAKLDVNTLLAGLLGDGLMIGDVPVNLDLSKFLLGTYVDMTDPTKAYLKADKAGVLFALLDMLGLLDMIYDMGMVGVTKLIQYKKIDSPLGIDYSVAPLAKTLDRGLGGLSYGATTEVPDWFRPSHAQYLADNADLVVKWFWDSFIWDSGTSTRTDIGDKVQVLLNGLLDGVTVGSSLQDTVGTIWNNQKYIKDNLLMVLSMILSLDDMLEGFGDLRAMLQGMLVDQDKLDALKLDRDNKKVARDNAKVALAAAETALAPAQTAWENAKQDVQDALATFGLGSPEMDAAWDLAVAAREIRDPLRTAKDTAQAKYNAADEAYKKAQQLVTDNLPLGGLFGEDFDVGALLGSSPPTITLKDILAKFISIYDEDTQTTIPLDLDDMLSPIKAIFESDSLYQTYLADSNILDILEAKYRAKNPLASDATQAQQDAYEANVTKHMEEVKANLKAALRDDPDVRKHVLEHAPEITGVTDEDSFKDALVDLLSKLMPVLNVFLAGRNILLINDPTIQPNNEEGVPGGPGDSPADDHVLLRVFGNNGYETSLLPILAGIGADIPGFLDDLKPYDVFIGENLAPGAWAALRTAEAALATAQENLANDPGNAATLEPLVLAARLDVSNAQAALNTAMAGQEAVVAKTQVLAVFEPILFLLNSLADSPVQTLLRVLPNVAFFISDETNPQGSKSLFLQALDNILFPLTSLLGMLKPDVGAPNAEPNPMDYGFGAYPDFIGWSGKPDKNTYPGLKDGEPKKPEKLAPPNAPPGWPLEPNEDDFILADDYKGIPGYNTKYAEYEALLAAFESTPEYAQYQTNMTNYNNAWATTEKEYKDKKEVYDADLALYNAALKKYAEERAVLNAWMKDTAYPKGQEFEKLLEAWNTSAGMLSSVTGLLDDFLGDLKLGDMLNDLLVGPDGFLKDFLPAGFTIEALIIGTVQAFSDGDPAWAWLDNMDVNSPPKGSAKAKYVHVNMADLLTQLMVLTGAFDLIEDFQGLIDMLNVWDREDHLKQPLLIDYGQAPAPQMVDWANAGDWLDDGKPAGPGYASRTEQVAEFLADNVDAVLNWLWRDFVYGNGPGPKTLNEFGADTLEGLVKKPVTVEKTLAETVASLLSTSVYTQDNLKMIVEMLYDPANSDPEKRGLLYDLLGMTFPIKIDDGPDGIADTSDDVVLDLVLEKLLPKLVLLGNDPLDLHGMFDNLMDYDGLGIYKVDDTNQTTAKTTFLDALYYMLGPVMPLLRVFLAGTDIKLLNMDVIRGYDSPPNVPDPVTQIDGKGFLVIDGYNGYRTGLLPLLMAIGGGVPGYLGQLMTPDNFENPATLDADRLEAIVEPLLWVIDELAKNPVKTLLQVLPNLLYFIVPGDDGTSLISQALNNILFPVTALLGNLLTSRTLTDLVNDALLKDLLTDDKGNAAGIKLPFADLELLKELAEASKAVTDAKADLEAKKAVAEATKDPADIAAVTAAEAALKQAQGVLQDALNELTNLSGMIDGLLGAVLGMTLEELGVTGLGGLGKMPIGDLLKKLIVGEKTIFPGPWNTVGIDSKDAPVEDKASYVKVEGNEKQLIFTLVDTLMQSGLLDDLLEDVDTKDILKVIIGLLNIDGDRPVGYGPDLIDYSKAPASTKVDYDVDGLPTNASLAAVGLEDRKELFEYADFLLDNIDAVLNWAWKELVYGAEHTDPDTSLTNNPLREYVQDLLDGLFGASVTLTDNLQTTVNGIFDDNLYTAGNVDTVANLLVGPKGILNFLNTPIELKENEGTPEEKLLFKLELPDLLKKAAGIEDWNGAYQALDVAQILDDIEHFTPGTPVSDKTTFVKALSELLAPLGPLLRVFLAESDLVLIRDNQTAIGTPDHIDINDDKGLIRIYGTNGYETGLLPLLMALGAGLEDTARTAYLGSLKDYDYILNTPGGLWEAILDPVLMLLESLVDQPVTTLLGILPNLLYFILPQELSQGVYGESLLSQALVNILYPVTSMLPDLWPLIRTMLADKDGNIIITIVDDEDDDTKDVTIDLTELDIKELKDLGIGLNVALTDLVGSFEIKLGEQTLDLLPLLYSLLTGEVTDAAYAAQDYNGASTDSLLVAANAKFNKLGKIPPGAQYLEVDKALLLVSVIDAVLDMGLLDDFGGEDTLTALLKLLNVNQTRPPNYGPGWIDYAKAPAVNTAANVDPNLQFMLDEGYAQFLLDNVDGIVQWAWDELIVANPTFKAALEEMLSGLGIPITLNPAGLSATINDLLGDVLFVPDNLKLVADMIANPLASLTDIAVLKDENGKTTLSLLDILGVVGEISDPSVPGGGPGTSLKDVLEDVINGFTLYTPPATISGASAFKNELVDMLAPLAQVMRLLLMEDNDLVLIKDPDVNDDYGLIRIFGANGYETGLLPLLMGIGGSIDGFLDKFWTLDDIKNAGNPDKALIEAILDPILFLLQKLADDPLNTLLQMLPNVAYFVLPGPNGESLLSQALENIIYPIGELLKALPPSLLGSLGLDIGDFDLTNLCKSLNNMLMGLLNGIDLGNGVGLVDLLRKLVVADNVSFPADFAKYGVYGGAANGARYLKVNLPLLLVQIIDAVLDMTGADTAELGPTLHDILSLLNYNQKPPEPEPLDYANAGWKEAEENNQKVDGLYNKYDWLKPEHTEFLVDNVDRVVDWAWAALFTDKGVYENGKPLANQGGRDWLQDLLGGLLGVNVKVEDTLQGTLEGLLGNLLYTKSNLDLIVNMVLGLKDSVDIEIMTGLTLNDVIKAAVVIGDQPLDLNQLFQPFVNYKNKQLPANLTEAQFKGTLKNLLTPLVPLLRVFLTDSDLLGIVHQNVNGGQGLIKIAGANGYETGLLPILMALGADLFDENGKNGYLDTLKTYTQVLASDGALLDAILDPLLYLLNALVQDPVHTLLRVLPNVAYFIIDPVTGYDAKGNPIYGNSMLQTALNNILLPLAPILKLDLIKSLLPEGFDLTKLLLGNMIDGLLSEIGLSLKDLIVGEVKRFDGAYLRSLGINSSLTNPNNQASYLHVNMGGLLVNLLELLGVLQMLDETGFAGLINLLNTPGRMPHGPPHRVHYPQVETADLKAVYDCVFWTRKDALALVGKLPALVDDIFELIFGKRLGSVPLEADASASGYLRDMLGDALYTQDNFKSIVGMVQDLLAGLDLNMAIIPGKTEDDPPNRTLGHLLDNAVQIGDTQLNLLDVIDQLKDWVPSGGVDGQRNFINELLDFLKPVVPVLDFLLFGEDLVVLPIEVKPDSGSKAKGLVYAEGYEGYKYGLIPLYEALLKPLGAQGEIRDAGWFEGKSNRQKLEGILHPILYAVEQLVTDPLKNLLAMLPNLVYFIFDRNVIEECSKVNTPLEDSLDNILYAVTSVLGTMNGTGNGGSAALFAMLGIDFNVPVLLTDLLNGLLGDMNIPIDVGELLEQLHVGTLTTYPSKSGDDKAKYLSLEADQDRADLLTVVLKWLIGMVQDENNGDLRESIISMLVNLIMTEGAFGSRALHWGLHYILWVLRLGGTDITLKQFLNLVKFLSFLMPVIRWIGKMFGLF